MYLLTILNNVGKYSVCLHFLSKKLLKLLSRQKKQMTYVVIDALKVKLKIFFFSFTKFI